jgi:hypothetical protein
VLSTEKPFSTLCPRTGSRVFIGDELLDLTNPVEIICPICERRHIWTPATLTLSEPGDAAGDGHSKKRNDTVAG